MLSIAARELGISDTELQLARESGAPIAVPYATWLQQTAKTPAYNALEEHVRFSPDGLTLAQAKIEEQRIEQMAEQEQQRAQVLVTESEQAQAGYQLVYDDIRSKLQAAGRPEGQFTARRWDAYIDKSAKLWAAHAVTEAARRGITVDQWYQGANRPEIRRGELDAQGGLNQEALHASLADFDRFTTEKIGTGVGQNLKGWGLNFTTSVALRDYYRQMFEQYRAKDGQKAIGYRVNIAEDTDLMNWETSLGEQPAKVQQGIEKILKAHPELNSLGNINAREFYYALAETLGGAKEASLALRDVGILGHSYVMDAHEYGKVKNFVVYDEQSIEIAGKDYFQGGVDENDKPGFRNGIPPEQIINTPEIQRAREEQAAKPSTHLINTPERQRLRQEIADKLYGEGAKIKGRKCWLIIGLPASGKSSIATPLVEQTGALIIDADEAKAFIPEYENGRFAGAVHQESSDIADQVFDKAIDNGDNFIWPLVGKNPEKLRIIGEELKQEGYQVNLILVELNPKEAAVRAVERWKTTGRFVDPEYVLSVGLHPAKNYAKLKKEGGFDSYEHYSNEGPRGTKPILIESISGKETTTRSGRRDTGRDNQNAEKAERKARSEKITPDQQRSGVLLTDDPDNPNILYQDDASLGFYSAVHRAISEMDFKSMPAKDLLNLIKKMPGIKKDELNWIGLPEYLEGLAQQGQKVSKEAVLEFVEAGGVELQEIEYSDSEETTYEKYALPGAENYREVLLTLPVPIGEENDAFRGPHWKGVPNVLVHFRLTDRVNESDNKVLMVEEIQSDWHQKGREGGYKDATAEASARAAFDAFSKKLAEKYDLNPTQNLAMYATLKGMDPAEVSEYDRLQQDWLQYDSKQVPEAPFKNSDAWAMLAFKRILRMAAEQGYDSVAWTTGEQQIERYDLRKYIGSIVYSKDNYLTAFNHDGERVIEKFSDTSNLSEIIGKESAEKLLAQESDGLGNRGLYDLDLEIGGEGMLGFYDQILPIAVQKYLKKIDPSVTVDMDFVGTGETPAAVHSIELTDKIKESVLAGQPLFQDQSGQKRGQARINAHKSVISLFEAADPSTFLHESAHLWLNDMFEYVKGGQADQAYLDRWNVLKDWLKVADGQTTLTTEQQEKFARGFEVYLMEGKAPSRGLRKVFAALKQWLFKVYRSAVQLNAPMSDEVRGVMDRMFATDEEIRAAEIAGAADQQLVNESDVAPEVWAALDDFRARAHDQAAAELLTRRMEEMKAEADEKLEGEWQQITEDVGEEMAAEPLFAAQQDLLSFMGADTDLRSLASMYRQDTLQSKVRERFDHIAEDYGFSGDELAYKILNGQTIREEQQRRTEQRFEELHPELLPDNLRAAAQAAIYNDARSELIAMENAILTEMVSQAQTGAINRRAALQRAQIMQRAAWRKAREILSRTNYKEATDATKYFAAERDAAVKAALAKQRGDVKRAQQYAEQRMVSHALAREALRNKTEVDKVFRYIQPLTKHGRSLMNMPKEFVFQIDALLGRFGFGPGPQIVPGDVVESLADFAKRMKYEYHELPLSNAMLAEAYRKPYEQLTLGELRDLYQALRSLTQMGRKYNKFLSLFAGADIKNAGVETRISIEENVGNPRVHEKYIGSSGKNDERAQRTSDELSGWLVNPENYCRLLDGDQDGPMQKYFLYPLKQARNEEFIMKQQIMHDIAQIFKRHYTVAEMKDIHEINLRDNWIPELDRNLSHENVIMFALNQGNELNRQRAKDGFATRFGENLTNEQVSAILKRMTEKDWQLVQDIWDYIEKFWPDIKKLEEDVTGVTPEKVEAIPVETPWGTLRGGYFPIAYDPEKSSQAAGIKRSRKPCDLYHLMPLASLKKKPKRIISP